jgi:8-oxo-dGTP pyrophosphatase MutT (NUDIX family)
MYVSPVTDRNGNQLLALDFVGESRLNDADSPPPLPLALVVMTHEGKVLMIFNRWRQEWELPGGMIEAGETPRQAAFRELLEETGGVEGSGVTAESLAFHARALFSLKRPDRLEYAAVYSTRLDALPELKTNEEASAFLWWTPDAAGEGNTGENMSALDAAIARQVVGAGC